MTAIAPASIQIALEKCDTTAFEKYAQTAFGAVIGLNFKRLGGHKDGGADGFVDADIQEDVDRPTVFFQASKEVDPEAKIRRTVARLRDFGRDLKALYYASSRTRRTWCKYSHI